MKVRQIPFSAPMVRAILEGRKTQTRRLVKPQPSPELLADYAEIRARHGSTRTDAQILSDCMPCPYGQPGDRLWVRETWACLDSHIRHGSRLAFRADTPDGECVRVDAPWRSPIHMPRWASRITLEIVSVRVERLQDISDEDSLAEGIYPTSTGLYPGSPRAEYRKLWEQINGPGSWDANPWVWVIEFKAVTP